MPSAGTMFLAPVVEYGLAADRHTTEQEWLNPDPAIDGICV